MSKLLEIHPSELKFTVELKKQSLCLVQLTNITNYHVAYKVKTTSPKKYCVLPNVGIVMPNSSRTFKVVMQMPKAGPLDFECKDKFLIQSTAVSAGTAVEDIKSSTFVKDSGNYIEEKKLKVILVSPPDSPTLSPINGAVGQGLECETSFFRDQSGNEVGNLSELHRVYEDNEDPALVNIKEEKPEDDQKVKPVKSVFFKLENDIEELKPAKDVEELKQVKYVEGLNPVEETEKLKPVTNIGESNPLKYVEELKPAMNVKLNPAKYGGELNPAEAGEVLKPANEEEEEMKPAIEVGLKSFGDVELKPGKAVELEKAKSIEDLKLVKDVEEIKLKLNELELNLSKAEFTISKLVVERNSNIEERKILQEKVAECTKRCGKTIQLGFPLLFVCMVALISVVLGYRLRP